MSELSLDVKEIVKDILLAVDKINAHKEFPFQTLLTKLKTFDNKLHQAIIDKNLNAFERKALIQESAKLFSNARECLITHGQSISLLKEIKFKYAQTPIRYAFPKLESVDEITKRSKLAIIYNQLKSYDNTKVLPIYCVLDQYADNLIQKVKLLEDLTQAEGRLRFSLQSYLNMGPGREFDVIFTTDALDDIKKALSKTTDRKTLASFNKLISLFVETDMPNDDIAYLKNEIISHQFFSDGVVQKYSNGYTKYVAQLDGAKNYNIVINENGFLKLVGLKKSDIAFIKSEQAIETLQLIQNHQPKTCYALLADTKDKPYASLKAYLETEPKYLHFQELCHNKNHDKLVQYPKNKIWIDQLSFKQKPLGKFNPLRPLRAAKRGILSKLVGRIVMGPEMLTYDAFQIGVLTLTGLVMAKRYIYEHIGWSEPSPEQYSYDYYAKRLKHLEGTDGLNQLVYASNQNNIFGLKSQKVQTLKRQQFLLNAEIELTKLNLKTTAVCGLSLDVSQQAMSDMDHSMRQIQSLSNSIREIDQYESYRDMLRDRGIYTSGEALEEMRPHTSLSKRQIVSKINDHVKTYNMAQRLVLDYEKGLAKVQLMDQAQNFYNLLCIKENKKPASLFDNKYGMLLNKLNYKN